MSHLVSVAIEITDLDAVKATCRELGLQFLQGQKTYNWYGYSVGDYPLPDGFTKEDLGHCEHAIGIPGTTWQVGLAKPRNGKGYRLLFDFYGTQGRPILEALGGQQAHKFCQLYGVHKATLAARKLGHSVQRTTGKNGAINLVLTGARL